MENFEQLILPLLFAALVGYLLGSISFAIILTRFFAHEDVRDYGSGNAGATNVLRVAGKKASALTFLCDFMKCAASVLIGYYALRYVCVQHGIDEEMARLGMYAAGFLCIIGHMYPLYFGFRGGKGVVTAAAMMLLLDWRVFLICLAVFLLTFLWKKTVSLSSI
ncbi:MAG: glycerol-3-phosphate acyltransferase, partial [Hominenteromicrobium sp.]